MQVTGAALMTWFKQDCVEPAVAQQVVGLLWPSLARKEDSSERSVEFPPNATVQQPNATVQQITKHVEERVRKRCLRCPKHLTTDTRLLTVPKKIVRRVQHDTRENLVPLSIAKRQPLMCQKTGSAPYG